MPLVRFRTAARPRRAPLAALLAALPLLPGCATLFPMKSEKPPAIQPVADANRPVELAAATPATQPAEPEPAATPSVDPAIAQYMAWSQAAQTAPPRSIPPAGADGRPRRTVRAGASAARDEGEVRFVPEDEPPGGGSTVEHPATIPIRRADNPDAPAPSAPAPAAPPASAAPSDERLPGAVDAPRVIAVRAAAPNEPLSAAPPAAPRANDAATAGSAETHLQDVVARISAGLNEGSFREQLDARMLAVVTGDYERARAPLQLVSAEQQEVAARLIDTLISARQAHAGGADTAEQLREPIARLQESVRRSAELRIPALLLCRAVRGYGQYDTIEPARFRAGQEHEFVAYIEVADFSSAAGADGWYTTRFELTLTVLNRKGERVTQTHDTEIVDRCRNQRRDCFIPRLVRLPANLPAGGYVLKATVADTLGNKVAESRAIFEVTGS